MASFAHLDESARGSGVAEELLTNRIDLRTVLDVLQIHRHLEHVAEAPALRLEGSLEVVEHCPGLDDDIPLADQFVLGVDGHHAGDEQQVAEANGIGVVADWFAQLREADFFSFPVDHAIIIGFA